MTAAILRPRIHREIRPSQPRIMGAAELVAPIFREPMVEIRSHYRARYYDPTTGRFLSEDPIGFAGKDDDFYAYVGNMPTQYTDPFGYARKPGKTPNKRWPKPPANVCGKKPKWNSEGYWEGNGRRLTWDDRSHGAGVDRGEGAQGGHWDDENSDNRWDENGNLLPGSASSNSNATNSYSPAPADSNWGQDIIDWAGDHKGIVIGAGVVIVGTAIVVTGGAAAPVLVLAF